MKKKYNLEKKQIGEFGYIENFLTEEEIAEVMKHANQETGWYKTKRSFYIRNKGIGLDMPLQPPGTICPHHGVDITGDAIFPEPHMEFPIIQEDLNLFYGPDPDNLYDRLCLVLPPTVVPSINALQSFGALDAKALEEGGGGAYDWHYEKNNDGSVNDGGMTGAGSLYINDNYEGGILEFQNQGIKIQPKPGMLVSIPTGPEGTHRVTPVTKGVRHTLYGTCYYDPNDRAQSTSDNC